ncbi:MAG: hypothetical protein QOI66_4475, partial [Myxococcales bacterium]|nr:hypothetical protein [Myxococcales bacterium]
MPTDRWGIVNSYHDARGTSHVTRPATRAAIVAAWGLLAVVDVDLGVDVDRT